MEKFKVGTFAENGMTGLEVCQQNEDGTVDGLRVDVPRNVHVEQAHAEIEADCTGDAALRRIEAHGRICTGSEMSKDRIGTQRFVRARIQQGHESILEHLSFTAHITCDRAIGNQLVRHRHTAYSQESSKSRNYAAQLPVIVPDYVECEDLPEARGILQAMVSTAGIAQESYALLRENVKGEIARGVLPLMTATRLDMTTNLREWRWILKIRTSDAAHPYIRQIMYQVLQAAKKSYPVVFEDINPEGLD